MAQITINRIVMPPDTQATPSPRRWRRRAALAATMLAVAGLGAGTTAFATVSTHSGSTTNVSFVTLTPAHKLLSNTAISANKSTSPVVIGGTTTVPSNATTVQLTVSAKGAAAGTLNFYPAGNPSGGSGQSLSWTAGATVSGTIQENVGMSGELTFANSSTGSVAVTAAIIGYSTQVTDGDISGVDGTSGQVLTNTGAGGSWQNPSAGGPAGGALTGTYPNPALGTGVVGNSNLAGGSVSTDKISASGGTAGQVLTNAGSGTSWQTQGQAYETINGVVAINAANTVVNSITVPDGTYQVTAEYLGYGTTPGFVFCSVEGPSGGVGQAAYASAALQYGGLYFGPATAQALVSTTGGTINLICTGFAISSPSVDNQSMIATQVGPVNGNVISSVRSGSASGSQQAPVPPR